MWIFRWFIRRVGKHGKSPVRDNRYRNNPGYFYRGRLTQFYGTFAFSSRPRICQADLSIILKGLQKNVLRNFYGTKQWNFRYFRGVEIYFFCVKIDYLFMWSVYVRMKILMLFCVDFFRIKIKYLFINMVHMMVNRIQYNLNIF